jgi:pimeloyl-ACP methyl ester carboxylesterase
MARNGDTAGAIARRLTGLLCPLLLAAAGPAWAQAEAARRAELRIASTPGVVLAGTLHLPPGGAGQRHPLAVVIQGHGPNGRGGYDEIIRRLNADGIAALEYDKRGVRDSTGAYEEDVEKLTADAAAAVAAMRARPDIDGGRIALIGHSQGGVIAPAVAAADPRIAAVVTLAGSVGDGLPSLKRAIGSQMRVAGRPEPAIGPVVEATGALLQARIDGRGDAVIAPLRAALVRGLEGAGFTRTEAEGGLAMIDTPLAWKVDRVRSASDLRALRVPVLALFATKDKLVVASEEAPAARNALAGNARARVVVLDGLNHWFQDGAVTGNAEEVAALGPNAGSPRLVALVGDWLREVLGDAPR